MAIYRRFRVQQKYVNGQPTEEYRLGVEVDGTNYHSLEECNRGSECTELEYRWVDMESADDYICDGTNKYKKQMKQQKCVTEEAWTNVYPYEYRAGDIIEYDSEDCGYVSGEYHIYGTTDGHGNITISPSKEYYSSTDIVTITALPSTDYSFNRYNYGRNLNYGSVTYNSVLSLTMSHNWYVSAVFKSVPPSVGSLYYSYYNGTESWYEWSWPTFTKYDNGGATASIIIDYGGVIQSLSRSAFSSQSYLISISLPNCTDIDAEVFNSCYSLRYVNLSNCSSVEFRAFNNCQSLESVNLQLCTYIGTEVFRYCITLSSIDLPNCSYIGSGAFLSCRSLMSVSLPLCEYIEDLAFDNCVSLSFINLPNCSYADRVAFYECSALVSVNLPLCTYVGENAFKSCILLPSINLPNCSFVDFSAFIFCSKLSIVHLPKVTHIGNNVFSYAPIETLYMDQIPSVPSGGDPFGKSFSYLKSIIIPCFLIDDFLSHSIWSKYSSYFVCAGDDGDLKEIFTATDGGGTVTLDPEGGIYYSGTIVNIGYSAKPGYKFSYFQYGSTPAYGSTVLNESFSLVMNQNWYVSVNFGTGAPNTGYLYYLYSNGNEGLYFWNKSILSKNDNGGKSASIIIDYGGVIQSLPSEAFIRHSYLTSISISNCTYVGVGAFANTSLPFIDLPNCSYLGSGAFAGCKALTSISLPNCSYIGNNTFAFCYSLSSVNLPLCTYVGSSTLDHCSALQSVNLPLCEYIGAFAFSHCWALSSISLQNCSYVNAGAFYDCSALQYIDLPNCSYIGNFAFSHCQNLPSIDLPNCIYVETYAFDFCSKLSIVHLPKVTYFGSEVFLSAHVETLYMEQITSVPSGGDPNIEISYIKSIFIPSSLLDSFVSHPIWSNYSSYFVCV